MNKHNEQPDKHIELLKAYENQEFLKSTEARAIRILSEYLEPMTRLNRHRVNNTVIFFGSARADPENKDSLLAKYYWEAEELAYRLARWAIRPEVRRGKSTLAGFATSCVPPRAP